MTWDRDSWREFNILQQPTYTNLKELKEFLPVDIYKDAKLNGAISLSLKFTFQDMEKTLEDDDINALMDKILSELKEKLNIGIR